MEPEARGHCLRFAYWFAEEDIKIEQRVLTKHPVENRKEKNMARIFLLSNLIKESLADTRLEQSDFCCDSFLRVIFMSSDCGRTTVAMLPLEVSKPRLHVKCQSREIMIHQEDSHTFFCELAKFGAIFASHLAAPLVLAHTPIFFTHFFFDGCVKSC